MPLQTTVQILAGNAPAAMPYRIIPRLGGFPREGLVRQFRFADPLAAGMLDDLTGGRFSTGGQTGTGNEAEALTGGGLKLNGRRYFAGPTVDVTKPMTWCQAYTIAAGSIVSHAQMVASLGSYSTSGFAVWNQQLSPAANTLDTVHAVYVRRSVDGVASGSLPQTPPPNAAVFGRLEVLVITHDGAGNWTFGLHRGGQSSVLSQTWNVAEIQGPVASKTPTLQVRAGGDFIGLGMGSVTYDALSIYDRVLDAGTISKWIEGAALLASQRERA